MSTTQKAEPTPGDGSLGDKVPLDGSGKRVIMLCCVDVWYVRFSRPLPARRYAAWEVKELLDKTQGHDEHLADAHP